jgi:hypothetical protein
LAVAAAPVGKGLTAVPVMQLLVPVGKVFLLPGEGLQVVGGHVLLLEAGEFRLLLLSYWCSSRNFWVGAGPKCIG